MPVFQLNGQEFEVIQKNLITSKVYLIEIKQLETSQIISYDNHNIKDVEQYLAAVYETSFSYSIKVTSIDNGTNDLSSMHSQPVTLSITYQYIQSSMLITHL